MNKQKKRAAGRDVGTARNEFERELRGWKRSLEEQCCFFGFAATQTTPKGERGGGQLSTSFRFQQLSLGLHHAGRVWGELQEGDGVGRCFIRLMGVVNYKFFSFFLKDYKFFFFESQNYWL